MAAKPVKKWGKAPYWGVSYGLDPMWTWSEEDKKLHEELIEACRTKIRPKAVDCDKNYTFPRESLKVLGEMRLLTLLAPEELGGRGANHTTAAMVVETLGRYGCPSTTMVYIMHLLGCSVLLYYHHDNETVKDLFRRMDEECLIGTVSGSDPSTGGHFWFNISAKSVWQEDKKKIKLLKYSSWTTSAGFADWYAVLCPSPSEKAEATSISWFLLLADEVRCNADDWKALGMHGNHSGPIVCEAILTNDRQITPPGEALAVNDELVVPLFCALQSLCFLGIAVNCVDIAKKHLTRKVHGDTNITIAEYGLIQDYIGSAIARVSATRIMGYSLCQELDRRFPDTLWPKGETRRLDMEYWFFSLKLDAAEACELCTTLIARACGGAGYKSSLGLERLIRDSKASWVMAPSVEFCKNTVGKFALFGVEGLDYYHQKFNANALHFEFNKLTTEQKKEVLGRLARQVDIEERPTAGSEFQGKDFDNPFNTTPPEIPQDGLRALSPGTKVPVKLLKVESLNSNMAMFDFAFPNPQLQSGCLPGQYVKVTINVVHEKDSEGKITQEQSRYFSPVSTPDTLGHIQLVIRYESSGLISRHFKSMKPGDVVYLEGPCGGFEYKPTTSPEEKSHLVLIVSGGGVTPGLQLVRTILRNPRDQAHVTLFYFCEAIEDFICLDELRASAASHPNFKFIPSVMDAEGEWDGEEGYFDQAMLQRYLSSQTPGEKRKFVLCGGSTMIISVLRALKDMEVMPEAIFVYGPVGSEHVKAIYGKKCLLASHKF